MILGLIIGALAITVKILYEERAFFFTYENQRTSSEYSIFQNLLDSFSHDEKMEAINSQFSSSTFLRKFLFKAFNQSSIRLIAGEEIPEGKSIFMFTAEEYLSTETYEAILEKYSISPTSLNFKSAKNIAIDEDQLKIIFTLHYHLVNLEESNFKGEIINFPAAAIDPKIHLPDAVLNLTDESMKENIFSLRLLCRNSYEKYLTILNSTISKQTRRKMFGYKKLDFRSFLYLINIVTTRFSYMKIKKDGPLVFGMIPVIHSTRPLFSNNNESMVYEVKLATEGGLLFLETWTHLRKGDEVTLNMRSNNMFQFVFYGNSSSYMNFYECEQIEDSKIEEILGEIFKSDAILFVLGDSPQISKIKKRSKEIFF